MRVFIAMCNDLPKAVILSSFEQAREVTEELAQKDWEKIRKSHSQVYTSRKVYDANYVWHITYIHEEKSVFDKRSRYPDTELVEHAVRNSRPHRTGGALKWVAVMDTFGVGSTVAHEICKRFNVDPDVVVDGAHCLVCEEREEEE